MLTTNRSAFGELVIGLGAMVAAMFAVAAAVWINIGHVQAADAAAREARSELLQDAAVLEAIVDQETGLRGFLITGDAKFLQPYETGRVQFDLAMRRLEGLVADDPPELRQAAADIARQADRWSDAVAEPEIAAKRAGVDFPLGERAGKVQMDAIRADIAVLRQSETVLLAKRDDLRAKAFQSGRPALVLGAGVALLFALLIGGRSFRRLIADRREAEEAAVRLANALDRAQAAERAKTLFLSNMSHEMRTPLNGVSGMAEALNRTGLDPAQRELLSVIRNSAATLDELIGALLTLSRGGQADELAWEQAPFHLGDDLRAIVAEHRARAEAKGLGLYIAVAPKAEVRVVGDVARLKQLLTCLLSNAIKFTDRGEVRVAIQALSAHRYRFEVVDTGIGFDETRKAELFETFSQSDASATRRHGGAGLGLALARRLAADLGGQLDCHRRPDEGSVFSFDIDLIAAAAEAGAPDASVGDPSETGRLRILVVDDNPTNRKLLELMLDQFGIEWVSAEDGQQAVDATRQQAFDVILMDIQMPVMDGLAAIREIRRLEQAAMRVATPVIIVSANGQPESVQAGRAAGAQLHLTKPVCAQALVDALNEVLAEPGAGEVASHEDSAAPAAA
jgi:signal transduction histidine kinase/FixJ family two-component response regulator